MLAPVSIAMILMAWLSAWDAADPRGGMRPARVARRPLLLQQLEPSNTTPNRVSWNPARSDAEEFTLVGRSQWRARNPSSWTLGAGSTRRIAASGEIMMAPDLWRSADAAHCCTIGQQRAAG
jgi:hypothetical protein